MHGDKSAIRFAARIAQLPFAGFVIQRDRHEHTLGRESLTISSIYRALDGEDADAIEALIHRDPRCAQFSQAYEENGKVVVI